MRIQRSALLVGYAQSSGLSENLRASVKELIERRKQATWQEILEVGVIILQRKDIDIALSERRMRLVLTRNFFPLSAA